MPLQKLLPFASLKRKYPTGKDPKRVKADIGGEADEGWISNTCVLRMSKAFNYCGIAACKIPESHSLTTVEGDDGFRYAIRVQEFVDFLRDNYGPPDVARTGSNIKKGPFLNKTGIITWRVNGWTDATGHFTLWDGQQGLYVGDHDYFAMPTAKPDGGGAWLTKVELWKC
jgi:Type VI secretion system (T6SS), amidase effector protein 4